MKKNLALMFVITTGGILCKNVHAHSLTTAGIRLGGGALLFLGALGAVQSVYDIATKIHDIRLSPEKDELYYYERYIWPSMLVKNNKKLVNDEFIREEGAGFRTGMDGIVRLFLAKKGWDLMWHDEKRVRPHTQKDSPMQHEA